MKTISKHVEEFMWQYPFTVRLLRQGVLNYKAFARKIEPEISEAVGEKVSVGSIAVSLQRMHHRDKDNVFNVIGRLRGVRVNSDIIGYTSKKPNQTHKLLQKLTDETNNIDEPFVLALRSDKEAIYFIEKALNRLIKPHKKTLGLTKIDGVFAGLTITRETFHDLNTGGLSYPLGVLAEAGVMVHAVSATLNEEVIIVADDVADKAAAILRKAMWR